MAILHEKQAHCPSEKKNTKAPRWWFHGTLVMFRTISCMLYASQITPSCRFAQKKHGAVIVCLEKLQKDVETLGLLDSSR